MGEKSHNELIVVYIMEYDHSGSMLLDRLLGSIDGFFSYGDYTNPRGKCLIITLYSYSRVSKKLEEENT